MARTGPLGAQAIGLIGLGTMGANFARNLAGHGVRLALLDTEPERAAKLASEFGGRATAADSLEALARALPRPRSIFLLVPAGAPVDEALSALARHLEQQPDDFEKRMEYAVALNAAGQRIEAADQLLYIFRKKRDWNGDAARKQLVQFFEAWGPKDEATLAGRRKLSSLLFA